MVAKARGGRAPGQRDAPAAWWSRAGGTPLAMPASPDCRGAAVRGFERLREGRLLRKPEQLGDLRYGKRAIGEEVLRALHAAPAHVVAQGLARLGFKDGAESGAARVEACGEFVDAYALSGVERSLDGGDSLPGEARACPRSRRPQGLPAGGVRTGELGDHGIHDASDEHMPAHRAGTLFADPS